MPGAKILIVDDDQDLLLGLSIRLKANGYQVVAATEGYAAVSTVRKEMPDLIILDLGLPAGDGFVVMQRLKASPLPISPLSCSQVVIPPSTPSGPSRPGRRRSSKNPLITMRSWPRLSKP